ncbi:adhesion G protein-coupled receptor L3-like isoform X2 [Amphiura filiformis]|uniref:adhesion G protein-coupled receptor L3-like isoform X2 n=1 Tax=Amphiura filiformis TaxID=82378 RepID=UPI003B20BF9F
MSGMKMYNIAMTWISCGILVISLTSFSQSLSSAEKICPGGLAGDILWPNATHQGHVYMPCPVGIGEAARNCTENGRWQTIDYTNCTYEELESMKQQLGNFSGTPEDLFDMSNELLVMTSDNVTLSGHLLASQDVLGRLMDKQIENSDFALAQGLVESIIHSSGNLLDTMHNVLWENIFEFQNKDVCRKFTRNIEKYGEKVTEYLSRTNQNEISCETSDNLQAKYLSSEGSVEVSHTFRVVNISIPKSVFTVTDDYGHVGVALLLFKENITQWISTNVSSPRNKHPAKVHSPMVSCLFSPKQEDPLADPVSIEFALSYGIANNTCSTVNIKQTSNVWHQEGITPAKINDTYARCLTSTLSDTFYGVVEVGSYRMQIPAVITTALVISLILFFLAFVLLLYANRSLESDRATLVLFFLLTLMAGYLTMVSGLYATENEYACKIVALILHFSQLSYSFWMMGQVVQLMLKVTYKTTETGSVAQYCALGWITPSFVVASSAGLQWDYYGREEFCTLPLNDEVSSAFIIPNVLIAVTTIICLLCVTRGYCKIKRKERKLMYRMRRILPNIRACLVVLPLLILSWSVGAVAIHMETTALDVVWALVLIICSVCIFLFYGVFSSEVQNEYRMRYGACCGKKHGAVQDSPRPGWRDEISQLSQIREPSSIGRDADSTTTNGALPGTSGVQMDADDSGPWSPREPVNDSTASLSSSVASSLALKTKLKVFPLRKTQEQLSPRRTIQETLT